jgi:non-canonical purine NTP pyrophosphatase (RdgB/HAM1 family)
MKILVATGNAHKLIEINEIFNSSTHMFHSEIKLYSLSDLGISMISPETGSTLKKNAIQKSLFYSKLQPDMPVVAEDSGLEVKVLNGEPGIYSARYSGDNPSDEKNINKLLDKIKNFSDKSAKFSAYLALTKGNRLIQTFHGCVNGFITLKQSGENGFGYDPVFYYPPLKKTFAQLTKEQKNSVSHRNNAFRLLIKYLSLNSF